MAAIIALLTFIGEVLLTIGEWLGLAWGWVTVGVGYLFSIGTVAVELTLIAAALDLLFGPRGAQRVGQLLANLVTGGLRFVSPLMASLSPSLKTIATDVAAVYESAGTDLMSTISAPVATAASGILNSTADSLVAEGESTAANAVARAAKALGDAPALPLERLRDTRRAHDPGGADPPGQQG